MLRVGASGNSPLPFLPTVMAGGEEEEEDCDVPLRIKGGALMVGWNHFSSVFSFTRSFVMTHFFFCNYFCFFA